MAERPTTDALVAGKYELIRLIGQGGMGSVWEGKHTSLGTRVAIKFIEMSAGNPADARDRFSVEAQAVARLQSRYVVKVHDQGVTGDLKPYLVMEYLVGESLEDRLNRVGRMPLPEVTKLLSLVGKALQKAHDQGIVHRDLKPDNVYLTSEDDEIVPKVLDFGIAKFLDGSGMNASTSNRTKTGAVMGTPFYMSPEQARGLREVDHRADIWSFAVIVYRSVVGEFPFSGQAVGDLLVNICVAPIPVPSTRLPSLPPSFDRWFLRSVERDPSARFQSIAEQATELAAILSSAGGSASVGYVATQPMPMQQAWTPAGVTPGTSPDRPVAPYATPPGAQQAPSFQSGPSYQVPMAQPGMTAAGLSITGGRHSIPVGRSKTIFGVAAVMGMLVLGVGGLAVMKTLSHRSNATLPPQPTSHAVTSPGSSNSTNVSQPKVDPKATEVLPIGPLHDPVRPTTGTLKPVVSPPVKPSQVSSVTQKKDPNRASPVVAPPSNPTVTAPPQHTPPANKPTDPGF